MGYWAKDGSYQYDESDIKAREAMNETQGQAYERHQRGISAMQKYEQEEKRKAQAQREMEAQMREEDREAERRAAQARQKMFEEMKEESRTQSNLQQYGVEFNLRNPKNLEERRSRANYWRQQSAFHTLLNLVNGKGKKFDDLWEKYSQAKNEEERLQIVEQMEKMFPTTESAIRRAEKQAGYRR